MTKKKNNNSEMTGEKETNWNCTSSVLNEWTNEGTNDERCALNDFAKTQTTVI